MSSKFSIGYPIPSKYIATIILWGSHQDLAKEDETGLPLGSDVCIPHAWVKMYSGGKIEFQVRHWFPQSPYTLPVTSKEILALEE